MTVDLSDFLDFPARYLSGIRGGTVRPVFTADGDAFCYLDGDPDVATVWQVDIASGDRQALFDTQRLRKSVETAVRHPVPTGVPFTSFEFAGPDTIRFSLPRQASGLLDPGPISVISPDMATWLIDVNIETYAVTIAPPALQLQRRRATPRNVRKGLLASDPGPYEVISPDGAWLLGEANHNLSVRAVVDDRVEVITQGGEQDNGYNCLGALWSPNAEYVAATHANLRACDRIPVVNWLKPTESVDTHPMVRTGGRLGTTTPVVVNVRSRVTLRVDLPGEPDQFVHPAGWRKDGTEAYFLTMPRTHRYLRLHAVDIATGTSRVVAEETQDTFIIGIRAIDRFAKELILDDDKRVLWFSERDGYRHLYLYSTAGVELGQVTSGDFEVLKVVGVDLDREAVWFVAHSDLDRPYDVRLCSAKLDGTGFTQLTSATGVHAPILVPAKTHFLDTHSDLDRPPATDLVTVDGEVVRTITTADVAGVDELGLAPPEPFTVTAADGETILHGVLYKPPGFDPSKKYPVIEEIYGGPQVAVHQVGYADPRGIAAMAKASLGFVVYCVDGRGTPERGKAFQDVVFGRFHEFHVEDHKHVLEQLLERHPFMDGSRVGVTGGSWGGYNTVRSLLLAPEHYHVGVAVCPVYDLDDHLAGALEPYMGLPSERPEAYRAGSSLAIADRLRGKLLMIHGTADMNATFSATMKMCEALARADQSYDLIVMPDANHHFNNAGGHHTRYYQSSVVRYFIEHLQPEIPAA